MALSNIKTPQALEPVYTPMWYINSSDSAQTTNFRYVYDTYWKTTTGSTWNYANRTKLFPRQDGTGIYSPARILENYIGFDFENYFLSNWRPSLDSVMHWKVVPGEEYNIDVAYTSVTNSGGYVTYECTAPHGILSGDIIKIRQNSRQYNSEYDGIQTATSVSTYTITSTKAYGTPTLLESGKVIYRLTTDPSLQVSGVCINFARQFRERDTDFSAIHYCDFGVGRPLTNVSGSTVYPIRIAPDQHWITSWIFESGSPPQAMMIQAYVAGAMNPMWTKNVSYQLSGSGGFIRADFGSGPANLADPGDVYLSGFTDPVAAGIDRYSIRPVIVSAHTFYDYGDYVWFQITPDCSPYEKVRLCYLNRKGGVDTVNLSRKSVRKINIERTNFRKYLEYDYLTSDRGETSLGVETIEEITANSDWQYPYEVVMFEELNTSPEVYRVDDEGQTLTPVVITSKEFTEKNFANNKLVQYTITYRDANPERMQRN